MDCGCDERHSVIERLPLNSFYGEEISFNPYLNY